MTGCGIFVKEIGQVLAQFVAADIARHDEVGWPPLAFHAKIKSLPGARYAGNGHQGAEYLESMLFQIQSPDDALNLAMLFYFDAH